MNTYQLTHIRSGSIYEVDAVDICDLHRKAPYLFMEEQEDDFTIRSIIKIPEPYYPIRRKKLSSRKKKK